MDLGLPLYGDFSMPYYNIIKGVPNLINLLKTLVFAAIIAIYLYFIEF
jgi:hypothetical protein